MDSAVNENTDSGKAPRVFEEICDRIKEQLASGQLKTGDKLPSERDLAEKFGTSRSAVREALRSLERSGVVELRKGVKGGTYIAQMDSSVVSQSLTDLLQFGDISIEDLTESRAIVQDAVIRLACQRGTVEDFDIIERNIEKTELLTQEGSLTERRARLLEYYRLLGRATHNSVMTLLVGGVTDLVLKLLERDQTRPLAKTVSTQRRILAHLRRKEADQAAELMTTHLKKLHSYLQKSAKLRNEKSKKS